MIGPFIGGIVAESNTFIIRFPSYRCNLSHPPILRAPGSRVLLMGNEAMARGAIEGGVSVATGYPGTPAAEIIDTLGRVAKDVGMYVEWSVNEKVAFEIALAASYSRVRAISAMKHVGANVAHDSVATAAYMGARGGLLLISCDDPGSWSSQNEQDNRIFAMHAYLPVIEPSSPQEAKDAVPYALDLSEELGHPIMLRSVVFLSHATGDVMLGPVRDDVNKEPKWERDADVAIFDARGARINRLRLLERWERIKEAVNDVPFNDLELVDAGVNGRRIGVIAAGLAYSYVSDALRSLDLEGKVSLLKLSTTYPIPARLVGGLLENVDEALVVEELEPFVEMQTKALAHEIGASAHVYGKKYVPMARELNPRKVYSALAAFAGVGHREFSREDELMEKEREIPRRPPVFCPGCPHRMSFYALRKVTKSKRPIYSGDIGCYGLGYLPPFEVIDTIIAMGAGMGLANGFSLLFPERTTIAVVGDSTFFHASIPALVNAIHHNRKMIVVVLDNDVTAMTGDQPHPGTARDAMGNPARRVMIEEVAEGAGARYVEVVDPTDIRRSEQAFRKALTTDGVSVIVLRRPCELIRVRERLRAGERLEPYQIDLEKCTACKICYDLFSCPAIVRLDDGKAMIDVDLCTGCGDCARICPFHAIVPLKELEERVGA